MNVRFIGIDVHKKRAEVCILDAAGQVVLRTPVAIERGYLESFARSTLQPTDRVALEATTNSWAVARILKPFVAEVVVSNPMATKAIASAKVKTDKVDALVLGQLLRCDYLPRVWEPDEATQQLRELTGRRAALVGQRTAVRNRIHSTLAVRLIVEPERELFGGGGREWLARVEVDAQARLLIDVELTLHDAIETQLATLDAELARRGYVDARVKLLMTLPGVSVAVAQTLLAAFGEVSRFPDGDRAASYLGLVPRVRQSADKCYRGPISKAGNSQARWMLVQAAQCVARHPGPLGHFFRKLAKKKNHNVAVVATARKLAVIAWHMLTKNEPYRYAQPASTEAKLAKLRIAATGTRRRGGTTKGAKKVAARLPGGSKRVKPLAEVYEAEGLPPSSPPPKGEARTVEYPGVAEYAASLLRERLKSRRPEAEPKADAG